MRVRRHSRPLALFAATLAATTLLAVPPPAAAGPSVTPSPGAATGSVPPLGSLTTVPDYDLNPVLLQRLRVRLTAARARTALANASYQTGLVKLERARQVALLTQRQANAAHRVGDRAHNTLVAIAQRTYMAGSNSGTIASVSIMLSDNKGTTDVLQALTYAQMLRAAQASRVDAALAAIRQAKHLLALAQTQQAAVTQQAATLQTTFAADQRQVAAIVAEIHLQIVKIDKAIAAARVRETASAVSAVGRWQNYLTDLSLAGVTPPPAAALRNPSHLPARLQPVLDAAGTPQPGAAKVLTQTGDLLVLPKQVIATIGSSLSKLGLPYVFGATGPKGYDCSGLTSTSYEAGGLFIPRLSQAQYRYTASARIAPGQELPGDLVFFVTDGTPADPGHVAMVLDPIAHLMIQAPQTGDVVKISDYSSFGPLGFARPSILPSATPER